MASSSSDKSGFRARRLSVSDIDTSEFDKTKAAQSPSPGGQRQRRLSLSPEMGTKMLERIFPENIVGTFSCHGVEPGQRIGQSNAKINQDRGAVSFRDIKYKNIKCTEALFTVFDGHGSQGDKVSNFVVNRIPELMALKVEQFDKQEETTEGMDVHDSVANGLKEAFVACDEELAKNKAIDAELSGTTAVAVLVRQYEGKDDLHIWTAWAGDSRAVLWERKDNEKCREAQVKDLSDDHKPDSPEESKRIVKNSGFISPPEEEWGGPARVWIDREMTLPGLAMARSIGDHLVKTVGVTAEPQVSYKKLTMCNGQTQHYIVLASDGVWEFINSHSAMSLIDKFREKGATEAVTKLIETAAAKWRQEEGDYRDDITATCIYLDELITTKEWKEVSA